MNHLNTLILSVLFIAIGAGSSWGQQWESSCGTPDIHSESLKEWRANRDHIATLRSEDPIYVKMKIHLVGNDDGEGYYRLPDLMRSFCKLNQDMEQAGIVMEMDPDINYIASSRYNLHDFQGGAQMMNQYNVSGMVNCYIVSDPAGNCGYYSPSRDGVALKKTCLGSGSATWSHELGHFFSLPHTFSGWEGTTYEYGDVAPTRVGNRNRLVELADSSNCRSAADGFCDTKADYLSFRWSCSGGLSPSDLIGPDGASFRAEGANIMSYSNDGCQVLFSEEQIAAMRFDITRGRLNHISNNEIPDSLNFDPESFVPTQGFDEEPLPFDNATIRWEPIENADGYVVEFTKFIGRPTPPNFELLTTDTFINLDPLDLDFFYDWQVYPYNAADGCAPGSGKNRFLATELSSDLTQDASTTIKIFPNPVSAGSKFQLVYEAKSSGSLEWEILDVQGKPVQMKKMQVFEGTQRLSIQSPNAPGLYLLRLMNSEGITVRKLLVQ